MSRSCRLLRLSPQAVANQIIGDAVLEARARIREGDKIGEPLQKSKMFPPMVVQMISIGEESGSLDPMLAKIADFYEAEVDAALESLTAAISAGNDHPQEAVRLVVLPSSCRYGPGKSTS